jgi:hypothetical protein
MALDLTPGEAAALALRLCADELEHTDWLLWENLPELTEDAMGTLQDAVAEAVVSLRRASANCDMRTGVDSADLKSRAS